MSINRPMFPFKYETRDGYTEIEEGISIKEYARIQFVSAWIQALSLRWKESIYTDEDALAEANHLANIQIEEMFGKSES